MDAVKEFRSAQADLTELSLRRRPPAERQIDLGVDLVDSFSKMSEENRQIVQSNMAESSIGNKVLGLSGYLAEVAINKNDPAILRLAVMLHAVEGFLTDYRENIRYLVLICYACKKLHVIMDDIIVPARAIGSTLVRQRLEEFRIGRMN